MGVHHAKIKESPHFHSFSFAGSGCSSPTIDLVQAREQEPGAVDTFMRLWPNSKLHRRSESGFIGLALLFWVPRFGESGFLGLTLPNRNRKPWRLTTEASKSLD